MKRRYRFLAGLGSLLALALIALAVTLGYTASCPPAPAAEGDEETMKAFVHRCYGSPDVLEFADLDVPVPADDEVLVRIRAASVNPYDWHNLRGSPYFMRLGTGIGAPKQTRLGVDFAGVVETVGRDVSRFVAGDRVFGGAGGAFAEYVTVRDGRSIAHIPDGVTFEQAASLPIAAISALQALRHKGTVQPGQKVLINGASGGVGTFAVQIAKSMGAEVHGVCSTRNVELVRSLGADRVYDYRNENYTESGETYDVIVDMVGNHTVRANLGVLAPDGRLVIIGGPKGNWLKPMKRPLAALLMSPFVEQQIGMMIAVFDGDDLRELAALVEDGRVVPVVDRRFALRRVPDAIRYSETGRARGKIVINVE